MWYDISVTLIDFMGFKVIPEHQLLILEDGHLFHDGKLICN
jgi:hypothetical protein